MKKNSVIPIHYSTDVWGDLGFPPAEAQDLRIRSRMIIALRRFIKDNRLTQARAARLLGVTQPRVSDLLKGKIDLFSIGALVKLLTRAGLQVEVNIRKTAKAA
jgi:predicted XRE-type DNA-binding protein